MNGIYRILFVFLGCIVVAGIIGSAQLAFSANPKEVKLVESLLTHQGRSPSEHLMFEANSTSPPPSCSVGLTRIFPDGSKDPSAFVVPSGKVLILTDVVGIINEDASNLWAVGDVASMRVAVLGPSNQEVTIWIASGVLFSDSANAGITTVNSHSQSGMLAGPGTTVCLHASSSSSNSAGTAIVREAYLEGYLIDE